MRNLTLGARKKAGNSRGTIGDEQLLALFGARYLRPGERRVETARLTDSYYYEVHFGRHQLDLRAGDSCFFVDREGKTAHSRSGPARIDSPAWAVLLRGYMSEDRSSGLSKTASLPYVNGCSTRQVMPPDRLGDPTLQLLEMPPYTSEQVHHVHSTVRVALVLRGAGWSVVGQPQRQVRSPLTPGTCVILERFCPHHFETEQDRLVVLPLHVFSSTPSESTHPMTWGTHAV